MKKVLATGTLPVSIIEDEYEGTVYKRLALAVSDKTTEEVRLKSDSSYELLAMKLNSQNTSANVKLNKTEG